MQLVVKGKGKSIAVCETSPHRYGKSLTIGDHTVLPATFTPAEAGTRFSDPEGCTRLVCIGLLEVELDYAVY